MNDIATLRQQAQQFAELQQASTRLAEIERQQQAEQRQEQAQQAAQQAQVEFDQSLASFQAAKVESDSALAGWLSQGVRLIEQRQRLASRANGVQELSRRLAYARLAAGLGNPVLRGFDRNTAIQAESEELLKARTGGYSRLMTFNDQPGEAAVLLGAVCQLTGDVLITQRQPARLAIETSAGPVVELH